MGTKDFWARRFGVAAVLCVTFGTTWSAEPYQEYSKRIEAAQTLTALKSELMGDNVSVYNGATDFSVTDIELPGSGMPVRLTRRLSVELTPIGPGEPLAAPKLAGLGNWDIDVPYLSATFDSAVGWRGLDSTGALTDSRCSVAVSPEISFSGAISIFDVFQGVSIHLPGEGDRPMLLTEPGVPLPSDGVPRRWTSRERDAFSCIAMQGGMAGEGFAMQTTDGRRFEFNVAVGRPAGSMRQSRGPLHPAVTIARTRMFLLATRVTDRFGNTLTYSYNGRGNPTAIVAEDRNGEVRRIDLAYQNDQLVTASTNGRTWSYGYDGAANLAAVTLPDGSAWQYGYTGNLKPGFEFWDGEAGITCAGGPDALQASYEVTSRHPSGALGRFNFTNLRHYRAGVQRSECIRRLNGQEPYYVLRTPNQFDIMSLVSKELSGPGIPQPLRWSWSYTRDPQPLWGSGQPVAYPCQTCPTTKANSLYKPDGSKVVYDYGFLYAWNDGQLMGSSTYDAAGNLLSSTRSELMTDAQVAAQPFFPNYGLSVGGDDIGTLKVRPMASTTVTQDGADYRSTTNAFDGYARATSVTKASPWYSRTDITQYYDDPARWLLGQVSAVTNADTGAVVSQAAYDGNAMPSHSWSFGKLQQSLTYHADGTVATIQDGNGNTTTLGAWKRGSPQSITWPDSQVLSATVDDNGWITAVTDENGFATQYGYDAMGRVASITYPAADSVNWNVTTQAFAQVGGDEYGLGPGHWRQVVATGNARRETYLDALWRPLVTREYDAADVAGTQRFQRIAYDEEGRQVFASFPGATDALSTGTWSGYDALGRVTSVSQDSELGLLTTVTQYLPGNQTRTTNPRGQATLTGFQVFDQPGYDTPSWIQHPEGAFTDIVRDLYGKPTSIRRRNADGTLAVTRSYVYDGHQQLCKTIEPETGATATGYDGAGNITWTASGLALPSTSSCDAQAAVDSGRRADRTYDARNRLKTLAFPDGNGNQTWNYFNDGKPSQVVTLNDNGASQVVNTYTYNRRRLLTAETSTQTGFPTWALGYGYDANGAMANVLYPSGMSIDYAPNALGQPSRAAGYATGISYYPNGGMRQFTYGNGVVHSMAQNARQLPAHMTDSGVLDYRSSYDPAGNVSRIEDGVNAGRNRDMSYDGLDRLVQTVSPVFGGDGIMRYTYDVLDNLRSAKLAGVKEHNYWYDAHNRMTNVQNDAGATVMGLSYEQQGNLSNRNGQAFNFDYGNRLRSVTGLESYRYDAHGRRIASTDAAGITITSMYGHDGVLRRQDNVRLGKNSEYVQLNGSLLGSMDYIVAPVTPMLQAPAYSNSGSYVVSWNAVAAATGYELQEQVNAGAWVGVHSGAAISWAASGKAGATYGYRVRACLAGANCSGWSATAATVVQLPPAQAPSISAPAQAANGNFVVSWSAVVGASTHELQESVGGGGWSPVSPTTTPNSAQYTGRAAGTYAYRARGCNAAGCGPFSASATVVTFWPPGSAPALSAPSIALSGNFTINWSGVPDANKYSVEESANGAGWAVYSELASTGLSFSGKPTGNYSYRVRAGNDAGWSGAYSNTVSVASLQPPQATSISAPASSNTGSFTVSWNGVPLATEYRLEQSVNSGGWGEIQRDGSTQRGLSYGADGTYAYRVLACNSAGCSGYSNVASTVVTLPPATPTITFNTKYQTATRPIRIQCTLMWTPVAAAASYELLKDGTVTAYSGPLTNVSSSNQNYCATSHQVRACNAAGCSPWSNPPSIQQLVIGDAQ
ncbi:RHS repeat protein [uncultured Stenotrophomonas sp.]|uniref:RHS repeat protein n=1 Tax=uncultured Stenotrophomonas sp. TaxID=165438 RepID=UPI0028CFDF38|nr:RHS repeat protein [uncultured Stenotrophomonas sp.]